MWWIDNTIHVLKSTELHNIENELERVQILKTQPGGQKGRPQKRLIINV